MLTHLKTYLILFLLFAVASAFFYLTSGLNIQTLLTKTSLNPERIVPASEFHGWIAWWDENSAQNSLEKNSSKLKSVSPVWYKIDEGSKLQQIPHKMKVSATKVIPAITNEFDPKRVSTIVNNSDISHSLIEELANLAVQNNYQGFDIDWEEIDPKDQILFNLFIRNLAEFLDTYNLVVTISVHPQTGLASDRAVAKGFNLAELSKSADALKIMAYDFHNANSTPGAITPFNELKKVLDYTISMVPEEKIILGLPTYGYDWTEGGSDPAEAVSFTEASKRIKQNNGQTTRDTESGSLVGRYELNGKKHTIWFEDAQTLNKMIGLARSVGIYQFSFWRIGAEDPELW